MTTALNAALGTGGGSAPLPPFPTIASNFARYEADNPTNTNQTTDITFATTDVDVAGNKINITAPFKAAGATTAQRGNGTRVYFSSTGTLPAPLQANTPYYLSPVSGGFRIYPLADTSQTIPGLFAGETVSEAENWALLTNAIVLTTTGTGTHRCYANPVVAIIAEMLGNGYTSEPADANDRHTMFEVITDGQGRKAWRNRMMYNDFDTGRYNSYGKGYTQGPAGSNGKRLECTGRAANKRTIAQVFVARIEPRRQQSIAKALCSTANVDTSTDQINTYNPSNAAATYTSGDTVRFVATAGSTLPSPFLANTDYFARSLGGTGTSWPVTIHPTSADAVANTNIIDITAQGSGSFYLIAPARVGDGTRWSFFTEQVQPNANGNVLAVRTERDGPASGGQLAFTNFVTTGGNNGNVNSTALNTDLIQVKFWWPPGCTPPIRADNGQPLGEGPFYVSASGSSIRLHDDLVSATASVGQTTTSLANSAAGATANRWCIKYSSAVVPAIGSFYIRQEDGKCGLSYGQDKNGSLPLLPGRVPMNEVAIFVFKIDYNDPAQAGPYETYGVNGVAQQALVATGTKGNTSATVLDKPAWTFGNSTAGHVAFHGDTYAACYFSSAADIPDSDLQQVVDYYKAKYGIA